MHMCSGKYLCSVVYIVGLQPNTVYITFYTLFIWDEIYYCQNSIHKEIFPYVDLQQNLKLGLKLKFVLQIAVIHV